MDIELNEIKVRELVDGYFDDGDDGVVGYGGKLNIRPPYQREFIYKDKQRNAVIDSVIKGFPLNVMYWSDKGNGEYEILDGQQRTISIAEYVHDIFAVEFDSKLQTFGGLPSDIQSRILDYKLMVYFCSGKDSERLAWFRTINIAGEVLYEQEIRNAVYAGPWVSDARRYFSKRGCTAFKVGGDYLRGSSIRQDYLETVIKWISNNNIEEYMSKHRSDNNADALKDYFRAVIDWVEATFTNRDKSRKKLMKGHNWGSLHSVYKDTALDTDAIESEIRKLILDDEVEKKSGIYPYVLTRDEKHLNLRAFKEGMKHKAYEKQAGVCNNCGEHFEIDEMEADHITPWSQGGKTIEENCQMLCRKCNRTKGNR